MSEIVIRDDRAAAGLNVKLVLFASMQQEWTRIVSNWQPFVGVPTTNLVPKPFKQERCMPAFPLYGNLTTVPFMACPLMTLPWGRRISHALSQSDPPYLSQSQQ